jgi:hypothetical protein
VNAQVKICAQHNYGTDDGGFLHKPEQHDPGASSGSCFNAPVIVNDAKLAFKKKGYEIIIRPPPGQRFCKTNDKVSKPAAMKTTGGFVETRRSAPSKRQCA